ncbi:MAG: cAMP-activated global transcriptional regulator CRP [Nevskia sp.]
MFEKPAVQAFIALAHKRSYPPKQCVLQAGENPQSLFLILTGSVSVLVEDEHGREMVLAYLNAGEFFGEMGLFPDQQVRTAIVRTRAATLLAEVTYPVFRKFAHEHPDIMFEVAGQLAARLRDTSGRLRDLTFVDVAGRLARTLLELTKQPDAKPHLRGTLVRISRQEIARLVGCSREMAGRVLKKLQEDGVVHSQGRSIIVLAGGRPAK